MDSGAWPPLQTTGRGRGAALPLPGERSTFGAVVDSEVDWLERLRGTDVSARQTAAQQLREFLRRTLARGFGRQFGDSDLEDFAQDATLRVLDRLDTFAGRSKFRTWAASIAVNITLQELRRRKFATLSLDDATDAAEASLVSHTEQAASENRIQQVQRDRILKEAMDTALTPHQRTALLAELGGLPLVEVARRMNMKRGTLYKLLHDARKRLLAHFQDRGYRAEDLLVGAGDEDHESQEVDHATSD